MIHPDKVRAEAKKKGNENFKFRSYLKCHADDDELDRQFFVYINNNLLTMIAVSAEIAARCIKEVFRQMILIGMPNIWESHQNKSYMITWNKKSMT